MWSLSLRHDDWIATGDGHVSLIMMILVLPLLCSTYTYDGCQGGWPQTGYDYVAKAGGITTQNLYPYDVTTSYCNTSKSNYAVTVTNNYRVDGEQAMINQVLAGKTLSVAVDANQFGSYQSGIFSGCSVNYSINHAVNIVGVNIPLGYWIIRNSWGTSWGESGYMKLAMVRRHRRYVSFDCLMLEITLQLTSHLSFTLPLNP